MILICNDCKQVPIGTGAYLPKVDPDAVINKITGERKRQLDCAYVKWVCKSCRPLSMAENDKEFRSYIQASPHFMHFHVLILVDIVSVITISIENPLLVHS